MADAKIGYLGKVINLSSGDKAVIRCEYMTMEGEVIVEACENVGITPEEIITITENTEEGEPLDVTMAKQAIVAVPPPEGWLFPEGQMEITKNTKEGEELDVSSYKTATVKVPIPDEYIIPEGEVELTENNKSYDVTKLALATVKVTPKLQNKSVFPTEAKQTVTFDEDNDGLHTVTIEAIQTESKSVTKNGTVTPSAGKYLSSVDVNVPVPDNYMPIPTETLAINTIGEKDVTNYAKVDVSVPEGYVRASGALEITENNKTYDVTYYKSAIVAIAIPTETWTLTLEDGSVVTKEVVIK